MKKVIFGLLVFLGCVGLYANDTYFSIVGGSLVPSQDVQTEIEMKSEVIKIRMEKEYYEVTVDFEFYNPGEKVELEVGFPFFGFGVQGHGKIYDFQCWTNGKQVRFDNLPIDKKWEHSYGLENAYIRKIMFKNNGVTKTRVRYKSTYGAAAPSYLLVHYLYGTGKPWNKAIGKMTLILEENYEYERVRTVKMGSEDVTSQFTRLGEKTYQFERENVEPKDYNDVFELELSSSYEFSGYRAFPFGFFYKDRLITEKDLFWLDAEELRFVRNLIYALHGYEFKSQDLKEFVEISGPDWNPPYKPNPNFSEDDLSEIEKANIQTILEMENKVKKMKK